jgi:hypothetical protein
MNTYMRTVMMIGSLVIGLVLVWEVERIHKDLAHVQQTALDTAAQANLTNLELLTLRNQLPSVTRQNIPQDPGVQRFRTLVARSLVEGACPILTMHDGWTTLDEGCLRNWLQHSHMGQEKEQAP